MILLLVSLMLIICSLFFVLTVTHLAPKTKTQSWGKLLHLTVVNLCPKGAHGLQRLLA